MNIAASNTIVPPTQGRTDLSSSAVPASDADADGGDAGAVAKGDGQDFGMILSHLGKDGAALRQGAAEGKASNAAVDQPVGGAAKEAADPTAAVDSRVPRDLRGAFVDGRHDPSVGDSSKTAKTAHASDDDARDAAATDLSAQLALASQWAALSPANASARNDQADDQSAEPNGFNTKTDGRRGAARDARNPAQAIATTDVTQVQGEVGAAPVALTAVAVGADRNVRSTGSQTAAASKSDPLNAERTAPVAAPDNQTVAIDKLFDLVAAGASTGSPDPASMTIPFVTQISNQVSNAQSALTAAIAPSSALQEAVGTPGWSHELGSAAIRMATNDVQNASLRLNPEHLGPLDVQMRIDNGVAHMQFAAAHADTRHALESSRSTLDQMFNDQGIKLGDWSVGNSSSNGSFAQGSGAASEGDGHRPSTNDADQAGGDLVSATVTVRATRPLGLVDTFA